MPHAFADDSADLVHHIARAVCDCCAAPSGAVATQVYSLCNKGEQTVLAVKASACLGYLSARGSSCTAKLPNAIATRAVAVVLGCLAYTAHCRK